MIHFALEILAVCIIAPLACVALALLFSPFAILVGHLGSRKQ